MDGLFSRFSLKGKVALITGASSGIGEGIAAAFAKAGAKIVACSRKQKGIDEAADRIRQAGGEIIAVAANVSSAEDQRRIVRAAMDWAGRIDILVNNAGTNPVLSPLADLPESAWNKVFEVNLKAPLLLSQLVFHTWMKEHGGIILNISSVAGYRPLASSSAYSISKAALNHLTRCLAGEWGKYGIRVNALAPGVIKTKLTRAVWESPELNEVIKTSPIPRLGEVEDITATALLLVSDASSFITGHIAVIDGGGLVRQEQRKSGSKEGNN